jgi:hypothetical protein
VRGTHKERGGKHSDRLPKRMQSESKGHAEIERDMLFERVAGCVRVCHRERQADTVGEASKERQAGTF